jgi:hypothetical protein
LPRTNTLAYFVPLAWMKKKSLIKQKFEERFEEEEEENMFSKSKSASKLLVPRPLNVLLSLTLAP